MSSAILKPVATVAELRERLARRAHAGRKIGLVPTMGALHEGHLSLVRAAKAECDYAVVSIFVNPSQFGPNEDFAKYPRTLGRRPGPAGRLRHGLGVRAGATRRCTGRDTPRGSRSGSVAEPLEGRFRPGHFRGVATVVLKLLNMVQPDAAYFGQKDYQQALVIRRMAADLDVPVAIRVCPIVREPDGLAMSSRNRYLSPAAPAAGRGAVEEPATGRPAGGRKASATPARSPRGCAS